MDQETNYANESRKPSKEELARRVDRFFNDRRQYFNPEHIPTLRETIIDSGVDVVEYAETVKYKNPMIAQILSILPTGMLGIDRFYAGGKHNVTMGLIKMFTGGVFGILWLTDVIGLRYGVKNDNQYRVFGLERTGKDSIEYITAYLGSEQGKRDIQNLSDSIFYARHSVTKRRRF